MLPPVCAVAGLPKGAQLPAPMLGIEEPCVAPLGAQSAPTDQITDVGADAQSPVGDVHALTARVTYIFEHQKLNGSQPP